MRLKEIIDILRALETMGEVNQGGETETLYQRAVAISQPCAVVTWGDEDPTDIGLDGCLKYEIVRDINITLAAPSSDQFEAVRLELLDALIGYVPEDSTSLIRYAGGLVLYASEDTMTYTFRFLYNTRT